MHRNFFLFLIVFLKLFFLDCFKCIIVSFLKYPNCLEGHDKAQLKEMHSFYFILFNDKESGRVYS